MCGSFRTLVNTATAVGLFILAVAFGPGAMLGGTAGDRSVTVSGEPAGAVLADLAAGRGMVAAEE
jgi:hypothetical protein